MVAPATHHRLVVLPLSTIGVLLRATRTARGFRISSTGIRAASTRATATTTCVQCGLFDLFFYFSIFLFKFFCRQAEKFFPDLVLTRKPVSGEIALQ